MSGAAPDPLDRIRDEIEDAMDAGGDFRNEPVGVAGHAALDALVEVARAARDLIDWDSYKRAGGFEEPRWAALCAALARLGNHAARRKN